MASISEQPKNSGLRNIQFNGPDGKRRRIRLGKVSQRDAEAIRVRVEAINNAALARHSIDGDTAEWVGKIGDALHAKLAATGWATPRQPVATARLSDFLNSYIASRVDVKPQTKVNLQVCAAGLVAFFGPEKALREIKPGDADGWCASLRADYAGATASRTVRRAKQFFKAAVRKGYIDANPFHECKAGAQSNPARQRFISQADGEKVIDACPDAEWRLLFALSRWGELRCPSEHLALTWGDVDWAQERIRVDSPKTGVRWIPVFPELRPHLAEVFEQAELGSVHVITRYRSASQNLRTHLGRIIRKAGLIPWPKLWHNLRASRQTELARCIRCTSFAWIGNSAAVAA